jgi:hypothetical protein
VAQQVLGTLGRAMAREVARRAHDDEAECVRQTHLHHVTLERFLQPHACVVALRDDVDEEILDDDLHLHTRVACAECGQQGRDEEGNG